MSKLVPPVLREFGYSNLDDWFVEIKCVLLFDQYTQPGRKPRAKPASRMEMAFCSPGATHFSSTCDPMTCDDIALFACLTWAG